MAKSSLLKENATAVNGNGIISSRVKRARYESTKKDEAVKSTKKSPSKQANHQNKKRKKNNSSAKPDWKKGVWDKCEDESLLEAVHKQFPIKEGKVNWSYVSQKVKSRSCKQCRERWVNHLNPDVNKAKWMPHEDSLLLELGEMFPKKWAHIARMIPGRTENMVKIRWNSLNRKGENTPLKQESVESTWVPPLKPKSLDFCFPGQPLPCSFMPMKFDPMLKSNQLNVMEFIDPFQGHPVDNDFQIDDSFLFLDSMESLELSVL